MMMMVFLKSTVLPRPSVKLAVLEDLQQDIVDIRMRLPRFRRAG